MIDSQILSQYQNAKRYGGIFDFSYRGKIEVVGNDRKSFLHRMLTHDIASLFPGQGCYAALLTAQSKIITDLNVFLYENHILLTVEPDCTQKTINTLQKFVVMDDVGFKDRTDHMAAIAVFGECAESIVRQLMPQTDLPNRLFFHRPASINQCLSEIVRIPFYGMNAWVFLVSLDDKQKVYEVLLRTAQNESVLPISKETKEILRIEAGVPTCGIDFSEEHLLLETGIESRAVSFAKGCYPGQELVARMDSRAKFAKKLALLEISGALIPKTGDGIRKDSKEVGKITSACFSPSQNHVIAIGIVARDALMNGAQVEVARESQLIPAKILSALS